MADIQSAAGIFGIIVDLDRCEHGRHECDYCADCQRLYGGNHGNPFLADARIQPGERIGTSLGGTFAIVVPPIADRLNPDAWQRRL